MFSPMHLEAIYSFMLVFNEYPRISIKKLHKRGSPFAAIVSTAELLKRAQDNLVFVGPRLFVNAHLDVELTTIEESTMLNSIKLWSTITSDPKVRYAILFAGAHSLLIFKRGATVLTYAEAIKPTYPSSQTIYDIQPRVKGILEKDPYPRHWTELDWEIYEYAKFASIPLLTIGQKLNISWNTVKEHYKKIEKDCKTWHSFFPKGMMNYYNAFLTFQTDYEIGIRKELKKLDRTSFIYKTEDTLILYLFLDDQLQINKFLDLEKNGIIHDLRVSSPIQWCKPDVLI